MKKFYYSMFSMLVMLLLSVGMNAQIATSVRGEDGPWTDENNNFDWSEDGNNVWQPGDTVIMLIDGQTAGPVVINLGFFSMTQGWTFYAETNVRLDSIPADQFVDGTYTDTLIIPDIPSTEARKTEYGDDTDFYMIQAVEQGVEASYANTVCVIEEREIVQLPLAASVRGEDGPWTDENNGFDWSEDGNNVWQPGQSIEMLLEGTMGKYVKIHIGWFSMSQGWTFYQETNVALDSIPNTAFVDGRYTSTITIPDIPSTEARKTEYGDTTDFYMIQVNDVAEDGSNAGYANIVCVIESGTSVPSYYLNAVGVYPNPVDQGKMVTVDAKGIVEVYSISGARVLYSETNTFSTETLNPGLYFVKAADMQATKLVVR